MQIVLDNQPGIPVLWGTGTQGCGYGTCYAKYETLDRFRERLQLKVEPYSNQRVDWSDGAPVGAWTITGTERDRYREKVSGSSQAPAPANYVNSILDPWNWWPPSETPGDDGGVRSDWAMPNCIGFWWPDRRTMVLGAANAAHALVTPSIVVNTVAARYSMLPGAVLAQSPAGAGLLVDSRRRLWTPIQIR